MEGSEGWQAAEKKALRQTFRARREQLVSQAADGIREQLQRLLPPLLEQPGRLGLYWPLEGEIDLRSATWSGWGEQNRLALPAIDSGELRYRPWDPGCSLPADDCGIPAPPAEAGNLAADELQLLLVPALAIDPSGVRLGYGGGWYDRLRAAAPWRRIPALAVVPAGCIAPQLPRQPWDVPLDGWISEQGLVWINAEAQPLARPSQHDER